MKVIKRLSYAIIVLALAAGCGGAGAPPVELPAPVVGKIAVGAPDANGKSTIVGQPGAVTGGTNVLAINERLAAPLALWSITDALIPSAYAAIEDCLDVGKWVTVANDDGSFILIIDAEVGDNITIVLIDDNCKEISPRVSLVVPSSGSSTSVCLDLGVDGDIVDLFNADGSPIMLFQGSDTSQNKLIFGIDERELPGCFAEQLVAIPAGANNPAKLVVISPKDRIVWKIALDGSPFGGAITYQLEDIPLGAAYIGEPDAIALLVKSPTRYALLKFSIETGSVDEIVEIGQNAGVEYNELVAMPTIGPFADGAYLGGVLLKGVDPASGNTTYLFLYETAQFTTGFSSNVPEDLSPLFVQLSEKADDVPDAAFTIDNTSSQRVFLILADHGNSKLRPIEIQRVDLPPSSLFLTDSLINFSTRLLISWPEIYDAEYATPLAPYRLATGLESQEPTIYSLVDDPGASCNFWRFHGIIDTRSPNDCTDLSGASDPILISTDDQTRTILVGDSLIKGIVDASSEWYVP